MRIFKVLVLSLLSFSIAVSCLDNNSGFIKLVYLSVDGAGDVVISDVDVTKEVIFELSETVPYDVKVKISTDASEDQVYLGNVDITIPSNTISVNHFITFKAEGLVDVVGETIEISIEAVTLDIEIATSKLIFEISEPTSSFM